MTTRSRTMWAFKAPTPNRKDARFTFHTRSAVQSALADLLARFWHSGLKLPVYAPFLTGWRLFSQKDAIDRADPQKAPPCAEKRRLSHA